MVELKHLERRRGNVPLRVARGHFATNHSHINYYIDITYQKTRLSEAKATAYELVSRFSTIPRWIPSYVWTAPRCWAPLSVPN